MDDTQKSILVSLLLTLILAASTVRAVDFEYVGPDQKDRLVREFEQAKFDNAAQITNKRWTCDLFGVRSGLQVQRDVTLYAFKPGSTPHTILNTGSHAISNYAPTPTALQGLTESLEDQVRITANGQLIARLRTRKIKPTVLAYSICKPALTGAAL